MANTQAPVGFLPTGNTGGASPNFAQAAMTVDKDDSTPIYAGDLVKFVNTGYISKFTVGTAVSQLAGVFVGCEYQTATGLVRSRYWPGSGATADLTAFVQPCNLASGVPQFVVQVGGSTTVGAVFADLWANIDIAAGTGNAYTGTSGMYADITTIGTTATLPFRIIGFPTYSPTGATNDTASPYDWIIVAANVSGAGSTGL